MSMDSAQFHAAVYNVVRQIPPQHVTSYGHIAKLIGMPRHSRHVGQALKFLSPDVEPPIPWQRVISSSGTISSRGPGTSGAQRQREALEAEGIDVSDALRVSFATYGWFPAVGTIDIGVDDIGGGGNDDDDDDEVNGAGVNNAEEENVPDRAEEREEQENPGERVDNVDDDGNGTQPRRSRRIRRR